MTEETLFHLALQQPAAERAAFLEKMCGADHILREQSILGRPLTVDEVGYVTQVIRRLAALVLLGPHLDANYRRMKAATYTWPR